MKKTSILTLVMAALCSVSLLPSCSSSDLAKLFGADEFSVPENDKLSGMTLNITSPEGPYTSIYFGSRAGTSQRGGELYTDSKIHIGNAQYSASVSYQGVGNDVLGLYGKAAIYIENFKYIQGGSASSLGLKDVREVEDIEISFIFHASDGRCDTHTITSVGNHSFSTDPMTWCSKYFGGTGRF